MFNLKRFYAVENKKAQDRYKETLGKIKEIHKQTGDYHLSGEYCRFVHKIADSILSSAKYEKKLCNAYFKKTPFDELMVENHDFYREIFPDNYGKSYADPAYCTLLFGKNGALLSFFYCMFRNYRQFSFFHKIYKLVQYNDIFIGAARELLKKQPDFEEIAKIIRTGISRNSLRDYIDAYREGYDPSYGFYNKIVEQVDLNDLRYLFRYGKYISDYELKSARFMREYPEEKIKKISAQIVSSYIKGFERRNRDYSQKKTALIRYEIGHERLIRQIAEDLSKFGLKLLIHGLYSTSVNKQYPYDHRYDIALLLDQEYLEKFKKNYDEATKKCADIITMCSGNIVFKNFGEKPFSPSSKPECFSLSAAQQKLFQEKVNQSMIIRDRYVPKTETSFTCISFPNPEIGDEFEKIFEDILEVNMLDSDRYEEIQQYMIDELEQSEYVHVKGIPGNETDIMVKLAVPGKDTETNFMNCGADVNIPVGEVYTSPVLKGTTGTLHFPEAYLKGFHYIDLKLKIEDGYVKEYSCTNFEDEEQNKKYIRENLLSTHSTLPVGEFAIGTNTQAFMVAKKYNILNILPVLIIEKSGPHFALGDTCFSRRENLPVYNWLDKKEMIARDNEKSALRKKTPEKAYTNCHIDITLPYDSLKYISAVKPDGKKVHIIKDGRFVLKGTEELNRPLENLPDFGK